MKKISTLIIACALLVNIKSFCTIHVITVSNFQFSPASVSAVTGDTIRWVWGSGFHTTTDDGTAPTMLPVGAAPWNANITTAGQTFDYVLTVAGNYIFECAIHGFTGTLSVSQNTGIATISPPINHLDVITSLASSHAEIKFYIPADGKVNLCIYDLAGKKVQTIIDNILARGEYTNEWDAVTVPQGTYLCRLESKDFVSTRKFILKK